MAFTVADVSSVKAVFAVPDSILPGAAADKVEQLNDIHRRLDAIHDLPQGAQPVSFQKDFGDTATLMLTVASPRVSDVELDLRAEAVGAAILAARSGASPGARATLVVQFPPEASNGAPVYLRDLVDVRRE